MSCSSVMQGQMGCMLYCYFLFFVCVAFALGTSSLYFQEAKAKNDNPPLIFPLINLKKIMTFLGDKLKFPNFHCFETTHSSAGITLCQVLSRAWEWQAHQSPHLFFLSWIFLLSLSWVLF